MRNIVLLLQFLLFSVCLLGQPVTVNDKQAGYFPFDNCDSTDASGNGSFASWNKNNTTCACGVKGEALLFDNNNDSAMFVGSLASVFTTSNFTVSFYMKPTLLNPTEPGSGATQMVMSKQENCTLNNTFWVRYRNHGQTSATSNVISTGISQNDSLKATLSARLDDDRCWHHVVITRNAQTYSLYIDGVLRDEKTTPVRIDISNNAGFSISEPRCLPLDGHYFGAIDELRFYNRAYSQDEIEKLLAIHPDEIINSDTLIYLGNSFQTQLTQSCATAYVWSPATGVSNIYAADPVITPDAPTTYVVRFQHPDGCAAFDTVFVDVIDPDTLDCGKIFIPNAFTPGFSAGRNDIFGISNPFAIADFKSLEIFDRWGGRVFNAENAADTWDGTFGGKVLNPGIFLYRLRFICKGTEKVVSGTVTLLR